MAALPPAKLKEQTARAIMSIMRQHGQLPPAVELCSGGRKPTIHDLKAWFVQAAAPGGHVAGSSSNPGRGSSHPLEAPSTVCGCGGSCAAARASLSWPDQLPLVDYQSTAAQIAQLAQVTAWAEARVAERAEGWCSGDMHELLHKHQQSAALHSQMVGPNAWRVHACMRLS